MRERKSSRVVVVINPGAGKGQPKELTHHLSQRFQSVGLTPHIVVARNGAEMIEAGRLATQEKPAVVVAGGGDGTINAVASALVDTGIPLGVLPLGTLNDFAKDLHIPLELEAAIGSIIAGHDRVALGRQAVVGAIDFGDGVRCIVFQPVFWGLDRGRVKQAGVDQRFLGPGAGTRSCRWDLTSAFSLVAGNASAIVASGTSYLTISARRFQRTVPGGASPLPSQLGRK